MTKRYLIIACGLLMALALILMLPKGEDAPVMETMGTSSVAGSTGGTTRPSGSTSASSTIPETSTIPTISTTPSVPASTEPTVIPSTQPTVPPVTEPTAPPTTVPPTTTTTAPPPAGQVRLYTCDAQRAEIYVELAVAYYNATGIEVILLTPAEGESCRQALARYMQSELQPTMFCVHEEDTLQQYAQQMYDLSGSKAAGELYSAAFGMYYGEKLLALPVEVDWYGYIYNASLLKDAAFTRDDFYRKDMTGYNSMSYIAKLLTSSKIYPFGKPDFTNAAKTGLTAMLTTIFKDPDQLRSVVDLYSGNTFSTTNAMNSFKSKKIVFYAGGTADFADALTLGIDKLDLLPIFADGSSAMHYTCQYFWGVNTVEYAPDVQETLAFLNWMVGGEKIGTAPIDRLNVLSPYQNATVADNALEKLLREYMAKEPAQLVWNRGVEEEELAELCAALAAYYAKPSDTTWAAVAALLE